MYYEYMLTHISNVVYMYHTLTHGHQVSLTDHVHSCLNIYLREILDKRSHFVSTHTILTFLIMPLVIIIFFYLVKLILFISPRSTPCSISLSLCLSSSIEALFYMLWQLDYQHLGPWIIIEHIHEVVFRLDLPSHMCLYLMFYAYLLEPYAPTF